jgi:hypothetical protein
MPKESRLDHIYVGLTALERARLVLKTFQDDRREDPGWRMTMPLRQAAAFNDHIYTMNAANLYVAQMINGLDADLQLLWERCFRLIALARWREDISDDAPSAKRVPQRAPKQAKRVSAPDDRLTELDEALEVLCESITAGVARLWTSMRGVEVGLEEMVASFEGTDPLKASHRKRLVQVRADLLELIGCLESFDLTIERREPGEDLMQIVRGTVAAMRFMMG